MFSVKTVLFLGIFGFCSAGALFLPQLGVYGYIADYCIGPASQWWEAPVSHFGIRYSFTLALCTITGFVLQNSKMRYGWSVFYKQEVFLLFFLGILWFSTVTGDVTVGRYDIIDHPSIKFTKITIFVLLFTHIITEKKKFDGLLWVFILCAFALGLQAWDMPLRAFVRGRLEGIGGADFAESNFFAAFMAAMLPFIGVQFLRSKSWTFKILCFSAAAFTANAVVLCRSRGAFVGIGAGAVAALFFSPAEHRKKIILCLILGIIGGLYVTDEQFLDRMSTIFVSEEREMDESAQSRFVLWSAGLKMLSDKPLGIGAGNWYQTIGKYVPEYAGKDSHNTYVKCIAELGIHGFFIFGLIVYYAFSQIKWIIKESENLLPEKAHDYRLLAFGLCISLVIYLTCALTITMIYTELTWLLLMLPLCLRRVLENELTDIEKEAETT
jgi:probable O-glycosylation ligase (exosortase A-associated)